MADFVSFRCPDCRSRLRASVRFVGRSCACPRCGEMVIVPPTVPAEEGAVLVLDDGHRSPPRAPWAGR